MSQIIACIDASKSAHSVCDATAWCSQRLSAPALALHVLDKDESLALSDLTGAIGLGAREHLLKELAELIINGQTRHGTRQNHAGRGRGLNAQAGLPRSCQPPIARLTAGGVTGYGPSYTGRGTRPPRSILMSAPKMQSAVSSKRFCVYPSTPSGSPLQNSCHPPGSPSPTMPAQPHSGC